MIRIPELTDINVSGKKVICRFDFNVPIEDGRIKDDTRLKAAIPTIDYLIKNNAKIIMLSHLGRPKGKKVSELSLKPVAVRLSEILKREVNFIEEAIGEKVEKATSNLKEGELLLLENTRFYPGEKENDPDFSKRLASLASVYINDAFGTAHRKHASTYGISEFIEEKAAGLLMVKEIDTLSILLRNPPEPFCVILGGAKLKTKIPVIKNLAPLVDDLLLGGGMVFGFLYKKGISIGDSLIERELLDEIDKIFTIMKENNVNLHLPEDTVITKEIKENTEYRTVKTEKIPDGWKGVDIGPESVKEFSSIILNSKTVFWNGPMGVFEIKPFDKGTKEIARVMNRATQEGAITIVGGGDTDKAIHEENVKIYHISTGGGASLKFLTGKKLPSIEALNKEE